MRALPLRLKLALQTGIFSSGVLVVFGVGVAWHLYRDGVANIDRQLREVSGSFYRELASRGRVVNWEDRSEVDSLFPSVTTPYRIEIIEHGKVAYRSRNLGEEKFPPLLGHRVFASVQFGPSHLRISEVHDKEFSLRLATELATVDETREDLLESFFAAAPVVLLLVGLGAWWLAGRALRPVIEITEAAQRITAQRLDRRLPLPGTDDEIQNLTLVLNQMIDRLEGSFLQATRFTADASHELKTPLTIIRGEIEAELRSGAHEPREERLLLNLLEETTRLITISEGLLLLSRADAGKLQVETEPLDLTQHLRDLLEDVEILAERRALEIEVEMPEGVHVQANEHFLRQLLLNLFDNAIKYNRDCGTLRVRVSETRATRVIAIANTGPGLAPEQAAKIFDRFYRGDASRDRSVGGHGLGLSICREIARALDGEIAVKIDESGWTEFRVTLPAASEAPSGAETAGSRISAL